MVRLRLGRQVVAVWVVWSASSTRGPGSGGWLVRFMEAGKLRRAGLAHGGREAAAGLVVCLEARQWRSGRLVGVRFGLQVRDGRKMECMGLR